MEVVEILKIFTDFNRIRVYSLLLKDELCVCELEVMLGISQSNLSKHLAILKKAGIVDCKKKSLWTIYYINKNFFEQNELLIAYIVEKSKDNNIINKDFKIYNIYCNKKIDCRFASENKIQVINILEEALNE